MKAKRSLWAILLIVSGMVSCSKEQTEIIEKIYPSIEIERIVTNDLAQCKVLITPSENTEYFQYGIGTEKDRSAFIDGSLPSINTETGNESIEILFEDANTATDLTVFARAFNENGAGPVASVRPYQVNIKFNISLQYVTSSSIGINFNISNSYEYCRYYLGSREDREKFITESNELEYKYLEGKEFWTENIFGLEPGKEYTLFAIGHDRTGNLSPLIEIPFSTYSEGECPNAEFTTISLDNYKGVFKFTPNDKCGKIVVTTFNVKGYYDAALFSKLNFAGNVMDAIIGWDRVNIDMVKSAINEELTVEILPAGSKAGTPMEFYVLTCDKDLNPTGLYHYTFSTPEFDPQAKDPKIDIRISDITSIGATYTYTCDENTLMYYYETVEADWFDEFSKGPEYTEFFMHEFLAQNRATISYGQETMEYTEVYAQENLRYYAVACPKDKNGEWVPMVMEEYTTLAK